jgi:TPP-dependent pyruvate/acetoin dehydrogenase alpha subunit
MLSEIDAELDSAIREAESSPRPPVSTLFDDVYANLPWNLREQSASLVSLL